MSVRGPTGFRAPGPPNAFDVKMPQTTAKAQPAVTTIQPALWALDRPSRTSATTPSPRRMRINVPRNSPIAGDAAVMTPQTGSGAETVRRDGTEIVRWVVPPFRAGADAIVRGAICFVLLVLTCVDGRAEERSGLRGDTGTWRLVGFERGGVPRSADRVPVGWMSFAEGGRFAASFPDHQMGGRSSSSRCPKRRASRRAIDFSHTRGWTREVDAGDLSAGGGTARPVLGAPPSGRGSKRCFDGVRDEGDRKCSVHL